jgi:hypothetical protein
VITPVSASPERRADAGAGPARPEELGRRLATVFARGADDPALRRLCRANTTVAFHVSDAPQHSATLLLDRRPPELVHGEEPAEVTFRLSSEQAERFAHGELILALELMHGSVQATGPVRPFLALDSILRRLLSKA